MEKEFHIVLVEPLIPQNTGSIARLCVATNTQLHLIKPLGFDLSEKAVRRAGLDYWKHVKLHVYESFGTFKEQVPPDSNLWFISKFGKKNIYDTKFSYKDFFIFGKETTGLPDAIHKEEPKEAFLNIPMPSNNVRCINLANASAVVVYEALRQQL